MLKDKNLFGGMKFQNSEAKDSCEGFVVGKHSRGTPFHRTRAREIVKLVLIDETVRQVTRKQLWQPVIE